MENEGYLPIQLSSWESKSERVIGGMGRVASITHRLSEIYALDILSATKTTVCQRSWDPSHWDVIIIYISLHHFTYLRLSAFTSFFPSLQAQEPKGHRLFSATLRVEQQLSIPLSINSNSFPLPKFLMQFWILSLTNDFMLGIFFF